MLEARLLLFNILKGSACAYTKICVCQIGRYDELVTVKRLARDSKADVLSTSPSPLNKVTLVYKYSTICPTVAKYCEKATDFLRIGKCVIINV